MWHCWTVPIYPAEITRHTDDEDQVLLANTTAQAELQLHNREQAARGIGLYVNANKTDFMRFEQEALPSLLEL